jgi:putative spermidine/putrescine transport system ATP-binding protein
MTVPAVAAIALDAVSKSYDGVDAVRDVTLSVAPAEFVTLLGPSGSGKTTTMMMVAGFEEPTSGTVRIDGRNVDGTPAKDRNLGVVFQSYSLFPHMTAQANVEFPLRMRRVASGERRARALEALERVHLGNLADRLPRQLSGGQQQRVALARALVFRPAALLLDEPMAALDRRLRESMQREIKELQQSLGIAVVFVTHDQAEAMAMSDRIVVMRDGQIVQSGPPEDVYRHPRTDWIANFLGDTNLFPATLLRRSGSGSSATVDAEHFGVMGVVDRHGEAAGDGGYAVSVRPEHLCATRSDRRSVAVGVGVEAELVATVHLGSTVRLVMRIGEQELSTLTLSGDWERDLRPGDRLSVTWRPEDAQLVTAET